MITGRILIAHEKRLIFIGESIAKSGPVLSDPSQYTNSELSFGHYYPDPFPHISCFGETWAMKDEIQWTDEYIGVPEPENIMESLFKMFRWDY